MKNKNSVKSKTSSNQPPRALFHVYQKLDHLRDLIAAGDYPNAARLAEKMEISLRTVNRYLDNLRECGAPLANDRRQGGYYFTDPFWQLPPMKLSEGDLLAFFIAEQALKSAGQTAEAAQLRKSLSRLASFLPNEVSINLTVLATGISFQHLPFAAAPPETLTLLTESAINQQSIAFDYYSPHNREHTTRKANVLLLHNFAGDWFAVCYDWGKADTRDFHVGRMSNVKLLDNSFEIPMNWNAEEYLKTGFFMMRGGKLVTVEIHFDAHRAQWIRERGNFHPDEQREDLPDGSLRLSFKVGELGLEAVARFCLQYAGHCRVEKPEKLKNIVREKLQRGLNLHP
ncbi:WYL domain-containing transcriptional regulator [soil metagenome]